MKRIPYGQHFLDEADIAAVVDVLRHGWLTQGPKIAELEEALARRTHARYAVAVSSGTAALHIACMAARLGPGDKLVTSPNTFVASANCARYVGATPVFCDIDPQTLNLDPAALARLCAEAAPIRAIVPVHFAGLPCDMPRIRATAKAADAIVIEDASHALGAVYADGRPVGCCAYSDMTVFSFHPVKMIAMGEGGLVTTNDESLYRALLRLRSHGINKLDDPYLHPSEAFTEGAANPWYYEMQELGFNYRITDVQCALGLSQLAKLDVFLARRRALALRYDGMIEDWPHVSATQGCGRGVSSHHLYAVRIDFEALGRNRSALMHALREKGIVSQVHYIPVHMHPYYRRHGSADARYPHAERWYRQALSLPLYFGLSEADQDFVVQQLRAFVECG